MLKFKFLIILAISIILTLIFNLFIKSEFLYFIKQNIIINIHSRNNGQINDQLKKSKNQFWKLFTNQTYNEIPNLINTLTTDFYKDSNDPELSLLIGLTHYWYANERYRDPKFLPEIINFLISANFYLEKSLEQNQKDDRIYGWNGAALFSLGLAFKDKKLVDKGYNSLIEGIRRNPHYNYNAAAIVLSGLDRDHPLFKESIHFFWKNIDVCINQKMDRQNPDIKPHFPKVFPSDNYKFCWNTDKAPYSFEGRYLFMGDALVKNGQPDIAKKVYAFSKVSPSYNNWYFKNILEERILNADKYAQMYLSSEKEIREQVPFAKNSSFSCVLCHVDKTKAY